MKTGNFQKSKMHHPAKEVTLLRAFLISKNQGDFWLLNFRKKFKMKTKIKNKRAMSELVNIFLWTVFFGLVLIGLYFLMRRLGVQ